MSMCESILTIALVCTVKYLHYCDYYYTLGNDSQSTPKLIAYVINICKKYRFEKNITAGKRHKKSEKDVCQKTHPPHQRSVPIILSHSSDTS